MVDSTWTLSLREAGNGSDTDVTASVRSDDGSPIEVAFRDETQTVRFDLGPDKRTEYELLQKLYRKTPYAAGIDVNDSPWYSNNVDLSGAGVDSSVVKLSPTTDLSGLSYQGVWAVVMGGRANNPHGDVRWVDLDLFVLAEDTDYADRDAVETALGESI